LNHSTSLFGMGFFWHGACELLPRLALNYDSPDLCLLSSYDYRRVPPVPHPAGGSFYYFFLCPFLIFPFSLTPSFCFLYDYVFLIKIFEKHCKSNVIIWIWNVLWRLMCYGFQLMGFWEVTKP
jgi:hypothetical protein